MGKEAHLRDMEAAIHEAFAAAAQRRKEIGLPQLKGVQMRTIQQGPRKGFVVPMVEYNFRPTTNGHKARRAWRPVKYKMTVWLSAEEYAALLRLREQMNPDQSPVTTLRRLIGDGPRPGQRPLTRAPLSERLKLRPGHGRALRAA